MLLEDQNVVGRPKRRWKTKTVVCETTGTTDSGMDKDSKGQRKLEDSGGGLLPAVEGHSVEQNRIRSPSGRASTSRAEDRAFFGRVLPYFFFCLPLIPLGASREERDVCLLHVGMPGQEGCYTEIVSL